MQLEVGTVVEGVVKKIKDFGAFIELPSGETGMVHISEIATQFVKEIKDFLSEGQKIKVKIIGILNGKISLSIKQAQNEKTPNRYKSENPSSHNKNEKQQFSSFSSNKTRTGRTTSFEDMLSKFKRTSEEKMCDLKKITASNRGSGFKRGKKN
ncbi:MAG: S1 RNA-binding domain-containing protein [Oscillospiraceae bacterium]|jgi:S1 RNA binding domain protein|nr:S1 RNA-binding domain-containing protein [Oscillospiraceae bacterium]